MRYLKCTGPWRSPQMSELGGSGVLAWSRICFWYFVVAWVLWSWDVWISFHFVYRWSAFLLAKTMCAVIFSCLLNAVDGLHYFHKFTAFIKKKKQRTDHPKTWHEQSEAYVFCFRKKEKNRKKIICILSSIIDKLQMGGMRIAWIQNIPMLSLWATCLWARWIVWRIKMECCGICCHSCDGPPSCGIFTASLIITHWGCVEAIKSIYFVDEVLCSIFPSFNISCI